MVNEQTPPGYGPGDDPGLTQPIPPGSPTQAMPAQQMPAHPVQAQQMPAQQMPAQPAYGRPGVPQPYGAGGVAQQGYGQPPAPWQPVERPEVPFGPSARWATLVNLGLSVLVGIGVYLLAALLINVFGQLDDAYSSDGTGGSSARENMWVWALVPAGIVVVSAAIWGTLTSLLCLGVLRLSAGFRRIGAAGQGILAWLTALVLSGLVGGVSSTLLSFSGEGVAQLFNR